MRHEYNTCCFTLQHTVSHCITLQHTATRCVYSVVISEYNTLCIILQQTAEHCFVSHTSLVWVLCHFTATHTATRCNILQNAAYTLCVYFVSHTSLVWVLCHFTATVNTLQHTAPHCNMLRILCITHVFGVGTVPHHCNTLSTHCNTLQHAAYTLCVYFVSQTSLVWVLCHFTATHCQHTATHCNTLQHAAYTLYHKRLCCGYCATSQGSLDPFEVDLSARLALSFIAICVLSIFISIFIFIFDLRFTLILLQYTAEHCCVSHITTLLRTSAICRALQ